MIGGIVYVKIAFENHADSHLCLQHLKQMFKGA